MAFCQNRYENPMAWRNYQGCAQWSIRLKETADWCNIRQIREFHTSLTADTQMKKPDMIELSKYKESFAQSGYWAYSPCPLRGKWAKTYPKEIPYQPKDLGNQPNGHQIRHHPECPTLPEGQLDNQGCKNELDIQDKEAWAYVVEPISRQSSLRRSEKRLCK